MSSAIAIVGNDPTLVDRLQRDIPQADIRFVKARKNKISIPDDVSFVIGPRWISHSEWEHAERAAAGRPMKFTRTSESGIKRLITEYLSSSEATITPDPLNGATTMAKNNETRTLSKPVTTNGHVDADPEFASDPTAYDAMSEVARGLWRLIEGPVGAADRSVRSEIETVSTLLGEVANSSKAQAEKLTTDLEGLRKKLSGLETARKDIDAWKKGVQGEVMTWIACTIRREDLDEMQERVEHIQEEIGSLASASNVHMRTVDGRIEQLANRMGTVQTRHTGDVTELREAILGLETKHTAAMKTVLEDLESVVLRVEDGESLVESKVRVAEETQQARIEALTARCEALDAALASLQNQVVELQAGVHRKGSRPRRFACLFGNIRHAAMAMGATVTGRFGKVA